MSTEQKERPIPFSSPMVRAILEGRKTQTRRILKGSKGFKGPYNPAYLEVHRNHPGWADVCPYGKPGDRLWVKEAYWAWGKWVPNGTTKGGRKAWRFVQVGTSIRYMDGNKPTATAKRDGECGWVYRHGRFMPKTHSRLAREITEVRVQRLQDISYEDIIAEGWVKNESISSDPEVHHDAARDWYMDLWESLNGSGSWSANPWLWCVSFKVVQP